MSINKQGIEGEEIAREILKRNGFLTLFGGDWIVKSMFDNYYVVEVKNKSECFKEGFAGNGYCEFDGHGLDLRQVLVREEFRKRTGIRTILLIIDKEKKKAMWNFLDVLESKEIFKTKNGIHIYPINNFLEENSLGELNNGN
jgi:hypothetical protein